MYPVHALDSRTVELSTNPVDDYQRTWLAVRSDPSCDLGADFHVTRAKYRTCAVQRFHDVLQRDAAGAAPAEAPAGALPPKRSSLDCSEYLFPDVLVLAQAQAQSDGSRAAASAPQSPSSGGNTSNVLAPPAQPLTSPEDLNSLTKNQQFRLRKIQYSDQRVFRAINPNNCVLWDHQTGYVFFTGIWRLYQDVMHALVSLGRPDPRPEVGQVPQPIDRKAHCQLELDYAVSKSLYERAVDSDSPEHFSRRNVPPKRAYRHSISAPSTSAAGAPGAASTGNSTALALHYSDIHWYALDTELRESLCHIYRSVHHVQEDFEFHDLLKRIRGGYIKIQGTWLPFEVARALCMRFCYPIRYMLVPIFGPGFPAECADWYARHVALYPPKVRNSSVPQPQSHAMANAVSPRSSSMAAPSHSKKPRRGSTTTSSMTTFKRAKVDVELLDASQNLLELSRKLNTRDQRVGFSPFPQVQVPRFRARASSWAPDSSSQSYAFRGQMLPPISSLLETLEPPVNHHFPPRSAALNSDPLLSPRSADTHYSSPPLSPRFNMGFQQNQVISAVPNQDPHFVAVPSNSYLAESRLSFSPSTNARAPPIPLNSVAHFYNSNGHKYSYPDGMQVMFHPQNPPPAATQQPTRRPHIGNYQVDV
ncbi:LAQU0S13e01310g1_1 [Lachancea quebecensis]|uniref:LAQU0S13e01310g1_1 n=1 Tax=Lachancea quebecensis TaxID=1654605 RepID=A0A0P1KV16_9SACH|nr:LAQU0S13e01310g1_1 [Lachancea quebecensis]